MSPASSANEAGKRVRVRRRRRPLYVRYWWAGLLAVLVMAAGLWFRGQLAEGKHRAKPLTGYVTDAATLDQEYAHFHGVALKDKEVRAQFEQAADLSANGQYNGAILMLETVAKKAAVPVVFNDMGVLYAQLNDRGRAIRAFRDALARDFDYVPVRQNLERLKGFTTNAADPVTSEIEPNNNIQNANVIGLNKPVEAEISPLDNDVDVFKVTSPPAPRDLIEIHIENRSKTLAPRLSVYDEDGVILPWSKDTNQPGASLTQYMAPKPNSTMYLNIYGGGSSAGAYTLTVKTLKAFDAYEPNDDIYNAKKLTLGQEIEANIMDSEDTDFYSFAGPRTGTVSIDVSNRSATLIPALTTFGPDMRVSGFGPDIRTPGTSLHQTLAVEEGTTYYIQIWPQGRSSGGYALKIQ